MTIRRTEFIARVNIDEDTLELWLSEQWLLPLREAEHDTFTDADVARALLIRELRETMGVNTPGIDVALHLLDQVHGLRHAVVTLGEHAKPKK